MSVITTTATLVGARAAQSQSALSLGFIKQNADQTAALAAIIEVAAQQVDVAAAPAGMGQHVDVTV